MLPPGAGPRAGPGRHHAEPAWGTAAGGRGGGEAGPRSDRRGGRGRWGRAGAGPLSRAPPLAATPLPGLRLRVAAAQERLALGFSPDRPAPTILRPALLILRPTLVILSHAVLILSPDPWILPPHRFLLGFLCPTPLILRSAVLLVTFPAPSASASFLTLLSPNASLSPALSPGSTPRLLLRPCQPSFLVPVAP